jgi:drug/metabolite transporter (DMT)-like permease
LALQHLGLDRSSEATTAFLTCLSILFVPIFCAVLFRRLPNAVTWMGVSVALVGMWRMTGASAHGFGWGEALGVACAVVFSVHIILLNRLVDRDSPWRMTGGQFLAVGLCCLAVVPFLPGGREALTPAGFSDLILRSEVLVPLLLLVTLPTLASFSLMVFFQPRIDPTRAALIYLIEPVWAAGFAWVLVGRSMTAPELQGAALILVANGLLELLNSRAGTATATPPQRPLARSAPATSARPDNPISLDT